MADQERASQGVGQGFRNGRAFARQEKNRVRPVMEARGMRDSTSSRAQLFHLAVFVGQFLPHAGNLRPGVFHLRVGALESPLSGLRSLPIGQVNPLAHS